MTCYRGGMADDIKNLLLRKGMTKLELEQQLGKTDYEFPLKYQYVLGMCSGLGLDYDTLDIYFDSEGKLIDTAISQH